MTRAVLPTLLAQRWGRIINVTTSLDTMWRSLMQPYGGSKAANEAILTALAQELDGSGVTANVLVPTAPPTRGWYHGRWRPIARNSSHLKSWWRR
jgi:3-oxoacyl-[acyl-carrier protein] reductase